MADRWCIYVKQEARGERTARPFTVLGTSKSPLAEVVITGIIQKYRFLIIVARPAQFFIAPFQIESNMAIQLLFMGKCIYVALVGKV